MKKLALVLMLLPLPAYAETIAPSSPVGIEADALGFHQDDKQYRALGNAVVEQNGVKIMADSLTANYTAGPDGKTLFTTVLAEGHVHMISGKGEVFGDRGIYDVTKEVAVLKGSDLRLVMGEDTVTAKDSLEFWQKQQLAVARGNAVALRGDNRVQADTLTAKLGENAQKDMEVQRVGAEGNVVITTPDEIARGNRGLYDVRRQLATIDGNVRITRGQNQLNGQRAEINMATGVSRLLAGKGQRVRGLIVPKDAPEIK